MKCSTLPAIQCVQAATLLHGKHSQKETLSLPFQRVCLLKRIRQCKYVQVTRHFKRNFPLEKLKISYRKRELDHPKNEVVTFSLLSNQIGGRQTQNSFVHSDCHYMTSLYSVFYNTILSRTFVPFLDTDNMVFV